MMKKEVKIYGSVFLGACSLFLVKTILTPENESQFQSLCINTVKIDIPAQQNTQIRMETSSRNGSREHRELIYDKRNQQLIRMCQRYKVGIEDHSSDIFDALKRRLNAGSNLYSEHIDLTHFSLARPFHAMGCFINKVASSSLTTAFLQSGEHEKTQAEWLFSPHMMNPHLWPQSFIEFNYVNHTYFKFMVVRHPLERVLSAYRNKILSAAHPSLLEFRDHVRDTVRKGVDYVVDKHNDSFSQDLPSFSEFIKYILLGNIEGNGFESHWTPYWKYCAPCHIRYNVIGKLETGNEDLKFIWEKTGLNTKTRLPWTNKSTKNHSLNEYSKLSSSLILQFYEKFKLDFELFGYDIKDIFLNLGRKIPPQLQSSAVNE